MSETTAGYEGSADLSAEIIHELYTSCSRLGAKSDLLCIIGSFRDTLDDAEVLEMLKEWNAGQPTFKHIVACAIVGSEECTVCRDRVACTLVEGEKTSRQAQ
jgi:hypothetical protein